MYKPIKISDLIICHIEIKIGKGSIKIDYRHSTPYLIMSSDLKGSSQSRKGSEVSSQTFLKPSGQLPSLREKAKDLLECSPKDYANFVYEEYRFLAEKSKCLCEQLSSLKKKRQIELLKIRKSLGDAESHHKEAINAFEGRVKAWFQAERDNEFKLSSKAGGRKHLERLKQLEKAFKDNQKSYKKLHHHQSAEHFSIIQREIASIKRQYQEKMSLFQAKRERAQKYLEQCQQKVRQFNQYMKQVDLVQQVNPAIKVNFMDTRAKLLGIQLTNAAKQKQAYAQSEEKHLRDFYEKILQEFEVFLKNEGASSRSHSIPEIKPNILRPKFARSSSTSRRTIKMI